MSAPFDGKCFHNPGNDRAPRSFGDLLRWRLNGERAKWPASVPVVQAVPRARVDGDELDCWSVGHATLLVQSCGLNILTDPVWSERASPFAHAGPKRVRAPGIAFETLPRIDLILLSHNHYDHFDIATLKRLWTRDRPVIVTPLGNDRILLRYGMPSITGDWGDRIVTPAGTVVHVERAQHWSSRSPWDRNRALWGGFTVELPGGNLYFAGDTGFGDGSVFREAARHGVPRLALLPIGAYEPRWFMAGQHMNPAEAVAAFRLLGAENAVGIHWGVFQLTDEAINAPIEALATALSAEGIPPRCFQALGPGEVIALSARSRPQSP